MGSLGNTFGSNVKDYGFGKNIWHEVSAAYPAGGLITNHADYAGKVIPAGSMCKFDQVKNEITIVKASEIGTGTNATDIKGLLYHDVYVEEGVTAATGCVVYHGEVYADRLEETVPADVFAALPMIIPIYEKVSEQVGGLTNEE